MASQTTTLELQRIIRDHTPPFSASFDRYVLLELLQYASPPDWVCWAGQDRLSVRMQLSESTVRRSIRNLESEGWVHVTRKRGASNRYVLNIPKILSYAVGTPVAERPETKPPQSPLQTTTQPQPAAPHRSRAVVYSNSKGTAQCSL